MTTKISITGKGPNLVSAENLELVDSEGKAIDIQGKKTVALCACGKTGNGPFCDGSHAK